MPDEQDDGPEVVSHDIGEDSVFAGIDYREVEVPIEEQAELLAEGDHLVTAEEMTSTDDLEDWDPSLRDPDATRQMTPREAGDDEPPEPFSDGDPYESPFKDADDLAAQAMAALKLGREEGLAENAKVKAGRANRSINVKDNLDA